ncbi:MAG: type II secretion system protein [Patescibacteria group bacterium]|jgi:prepilin-type N-terminal cleavage/methylation domain-containing protein
MKTRTNRINKGFTLIELLVTIAIVALLTTLGLVSLNNARQKTRDTKRWSDIRVLQSAIEVCTNNGGNVPLVNTTVWNDLLTAPCGNGENLGTYMASQAIPIPPLNSTCTNAPSGDCYMYCATGGRYVLYTTYEGNAPAGGLNGAIASYNPATDCVLSINDEPTALPVCNPVTAGSFCLGNL